MMAGREQTACFRSTELQLAHEPALRRRAVAAGYTNDRRLVEGPSLLTAGSSPAGSGEARSEPPKPGPVGVSSLTNRTPAPVGFRLIGKTSATRTLSGDSVQGRNGHHLKIASSSQADR